jgi:hypothetical protein
MWAAQRKTNSKNHVNKEIQSNEMSDFVIACQSNNYSNRLFLERSAKCKQSPYICCTCPRSSRTGSSEEAEGRKEVYTNRADVPEWEYDDAADEATSSRVVHEPLPRPITQQQYNGGDEHGVW